MNLQDNWRTSLAGIVVIAIVTVFAIVTQDFKNPAIYTGFAAGIGLLHASDSKVGSK